VAPPAEEEALRPRAALLALALAALPLAAAAQAPAETLFNLVSLRADAHREVPNDLLGAVLAAEAEGSDTAQLANEVNRTMQAALAVAKGYRSVSTRSGSYQTIPVYDKGRIARWRVRQELRLQSTDIPAATELIGKLQASLVVNGMSLTVSPELRRQTENALLAEAVAAFQERARLVRDAMKAKDYRVRNLDFSGDNPSPMPMYLLSRASPGAARTQPAVEPGSTLIVVTVSGSIQLQ
jgi:predicted secreted protein